jgi:hypothetical protein
MTERKYTRRELGRMSLVGAGVLLAGARTLLPRTARAAEGPITEFEANKPIYTAVQYTEKSEKPDQHCSLCILYTAGDGGRGKCSLFAQGTVNNNGWCTSFSPKP